MSILYGIGCILAHVTRRIYTRFTVQIVDLQTRIICKHYGLPLIELKDIEKQHGHPSIKGHKAFAEQVIDFLKKDLKIDSKKEGKKK